MTRKILTLSIIYKEPHILLGMKKKGFGAGRWNGFGGKVEEGETIQDAAKREIFEETGIHAHALHEVGLIDFEFQNNPEMLEVHIFRVNGWSEEPIETDEMRPKWFHKNDIPFREMWPDDVYWLPLLLEGKKFRGKILFADMDKIVDYKIDLV